MNMPGIPGTRGRALPLRIALLAIDGTLARDARTIQAIEATPARCVRMRTDAARTRR